MVQQIYSRRQIHDVATLGGMLICAAVAKVLKTLLRHSRCVHAEPANDDGDAAHGWLSEKALAPVQSSHAGRTVSSDSRIAKSIIEYGAIPYLMLLVSCRPTDLCERLGNCNEYGMPSSHTQLMAFAFVTYMLLVTRAPASTVAVGRLQRGFHLAQGALLGLLTAAVAYSRIYLGYHSLSQVPLALRIPTSDMQLMRPVLVEYGLLCTRCLSAAASINSGSKNTAACSSLGSRNVAAACGSCLQPLLHRFGHPSLSQVLLKMASPCCCYRTPACMGHAADCMMMQESQEPLPAEPVLGKSKSLRDLSKFRRVL